MCRGGGLMCRDRAIVDYDGISSIGVVRLVQSKKYLKAV